MSQAIRYVAALVWLLVALYLGLAGVVGAWTLADIEASATSSPAGQVIYDDIPFLNEAEALKFARLKNIVRFFPFVFNVDASLLPALVGVGFGVVGSCVRWFLSPKSKLTKLIVVGTAIGLIAWLSGQFVAQLGAPRAGPPFIALLAILGGMFSNVALTRLKAVADRWWQLKWVKVPGKEPTNDETEPGRTDDGRSHRRRTD